MSPASRLAAEHRKIIDRREQRAKKGQELASWDLAKLAAIDAVAAGTMTVVAALLVVSSENSKRSRWMDDRNNGRR